MKTNNTKLQTKLIVQSGQYEQSAIVVIVNHTTRLGLTRHITRLQDKHATYGDNWAGWIKASVAIAHEADKWGDNQIIGGRWCSPHLGWINENYNDAWSQAQAQGEI